MARQTGICFAILAGTGAAFQADLTQIRGHKRCHQIQNRNIFYRKSPITPIQKKHDSPFGRQSSISSIAVNTNSEDGKIGKKLYTNQNLNSTDFAFQIENSLPEEVLDSYNGAEITESISESFTMRERVMALGTVSAAAAAFLAIVMISGAGAWRYFLAGGLCAAFSHSITTPIDVVKTRQQVDPELAGKGIIKSTMKIVKKDGPISLLAGLGPTAVGYLIEGSFKFGVYEVMKPIIGRLLTGLAALSSLSFLKSRGLTYIFSGLIAGTVASIVLCPMEALRIRMVAEPEYAQAGLVDGTLKMVRNDGIFGFWRGVTAMLCKQVPYTVTKNVSFDFFTTMSYSALKISGIHICARYKLLIPLVSAMTASMLSTLSSQPGDMLLSVISAHEGEKKRTREFAKNIMKEQGIAGFFVGIQARFVHVGVIVTIQLLMYDFVKRLCGIAATGL